MVNTNKKFGWAIIGSGYIVKHVLNDLSKSCNHQLISIYSRNFDTAGKIAHKYDGVACEKLEEAILMKDVKCVYIATPHTSHFNYIIKCLNYGIPVLCEKPIVMNSYDIARIIEESQKNKTYFSEIMSFKFVPAFQEIKLIINQGFLGKLHRIQADIGFDAFSRTRRKRLLSEEDGGGALFDIGIYLVSFVEDILGYTNTIESSAIYYKKNVDIIDNMILEYGDIKCELECRFDRITTTQAILNNKRHIFFIAEDALCYGYDTGTNIFEVINEMIEYDSNFTLLIDQFHVRWFDEYYDELISLCEKGYIKRLYLSIQHVNNTILKAMGRDTDFNMVYEKIKEFKDKFPHIELFTDFIVGFPGETEEQHQQMVDFFKEDTCFTSIQHLAYSDSKYAQSYYFDGKIPQSEIMKRWLRINSIAKERSLYSGTKNQSDDKQFLDDITQLVLLRQDYQICKNSYSDLKH